MTKKIICVIRVSTLNQEMESQRNDMANWLNSMGYKAEEIEWLESAGASARSLNAKYLQLLDDIKSITLNQGIKAVAIWHINRLGRVESKLMEMKEFFVKNRVQLYVKQSNVTLLDDNGNLTTSGSLVFSMFSAMVAEETAEMMDKMHRGKMQAIAEGRFIGGTICYGYSADQETGKEYVNEEQAEVIRTAFEMYAADEHRTRQSSMKIAAYLTEHGYNRRAEKVSSSRLHKFIHFERYRGEIVPVELWDKCQQISTQNYRGGKARIMAFGEQLIKCPECGRYYRLSAMKAYVCTRHRKEYEGTSNYCHFHSQINRQVFDATLVETVAAWWNLERQKSQADKTNDIKQQISDVENLLKVNQSKRDSLSQRKKRTATNYEFGMIEDADFRKRVQTIKAEENELIIERQGLENRLRDLNYQLSDSAEGLKTWADNFNDFDALTHAEMYDVIHRIVDHVEVSKDNTRTRTEWTIYRKNSSDKQTYVISGWGSVRKLYGVLNGVQIDLSQDERFKQVYDVNIKRHQMTRKAKPISPIMQMWRNAVQQAV